MISVIIVPLFYRLGDRRAAVPSTDMPYFVTNKYAAFLESFKNALTGR
jgi:hypothetical protein